MSETAKQDSVTTSIHCNVCARETRHDVLAMAHRRESQDVGYGGNFTFDVTTQWRALQCRGCEEVSLERAEWTSEDFTPEDAESPIYYPPRVARRPPAWLDDAPLPSEYRGLLDEIYIALHAGSRRLAMMGTRALIDTVMQRTVGDQGNFVQGLDALVEKDLISARDRKLLEAAIEAGHASTHRAYQPSVQDLNVAIDIAERLIHAELLEPLAQELEKSTPPRPSRDSANQK